MQIDERPSESLTPPQIAQSATHRVSLLRRIWLWFLTLVGPRHFYMTFSPWVKYLSLNAFVFLLVGSIWGVAIAPKDYLQGDSYRIIFIHVPTAGLALSIYFAMAVLAVISMVWKIKTAEMVARACADVGMVLCFLSLVTGAIWGKPTWGAYWVWDGRLTSMLILLFLYVGVVALFRANTQAKMDQNSAPLLLAVVGAVNLPIIKYSVVWWNTLHQGTTFKLTSAPSMPPDMYLPLVFMMLGFYCLVGAIVLYMTCTRILMREQRNSWVMEIVKRTVE